MKSSGLLRNFVKKFISREWVPYSILEETYFYRFADVKKLKKLRNKYIDERCFILGNGPSLNKVDFSLLKGEFTFGVNGIFYKTKENGFKPTFYVVEDKAVMNDNVEAINNYDVSHKFFPTHYKSKLKNKK